MVKLDEKCCVYNDGDEILVGIKCIECGRVTSLENLNGWRCSDIGFIKCDKCGGKK